jgi:hypothetical protein
MQPPSAGQVQQQQTRTTPERPLGQPRGGPSASRPRRAGGCGVCRFDWKLQLCTLLRDPPENPPAISPSFAHERTHTRARAHTHTRTHTHVHTHTCTHARICTLAWADAHWPIKCVAQPQQGWSSSLPHFCTGKGLTPATSAPELGSPHSTSAPGLGSPHATYAPGLGSPLRQVGAACSDRGRHGDAAHSKRRAGRRRRAAAVHLLALGAGERRSRNSLVGTVCSAQVGTGQVGIA